MPRKPRMWTSDVVYELTLRCEHRMFLLKPDEDIENIMGSTLGRALNFYPIKLHSFDTNINHFHCLFSLAPDQIENASNFLRYFNGQSAKQLNIHHGRRKGHVWSSRARVIPIVDDAAVLQRLAYAASNVVKDGMVEKANNWPGFSTFDQLARGERQTLKYLDRTAWNKAGGWWAGIPKDKFIREVSVQVEPIPGWEDMKPHQRQTKFRHLVKDKENELAQIREQEQKPILSKLGLMRTSPFDAPVNKKKSRPMPKCHAGTAEKMREYIEEVLKPFWKAYYQASALFLSGRIDIEFPQGSIQPPITTIYTASRLKTRLI